MERFQHLIKRRIPASAWVALGVVGTAAALLWWEPFKKPISTLPGEQSLAWPEVEAAPLTGPDNDPLPSGALLRLGRERLRQDGGALLAFSPNGKMLASVEPPRFGWPDKYTIHIWEVATGKEVRRLVSPPLHFIWNILFSPEGKRLSVLGGTVPPSDGQTPGEWIFSVLEVNSGKQVRRLAGPLDPHQHQVVVVSPEGKLLAWTNRATSIIHICDATTGQEVRTLSGHELEQPVGFTADGKTLIGLNSQIKTVHFLDLNTGAEIQQLRLSAAGRISFSADGKELLEWPSDGPIRCWDVTAGREVRQWDNPLPGWTSVVALSPDGRTAAAGYTDGTIRWWDTAMGEQNHEVRAHANRVGVLTFSRDGKILASQGDGAIQLWDVATGDKLSPREGHQAGIVSLSVAPDGRTVATVGEDHTLRIWSLATGEELRRFRTIGRAVAFSPDGMTLAVNGNGENDDRPGSLWLLDPATGKKLRRFAGDHVPDTLVFSPDGSKLAGGCNDTRLWDVGTGKVLRYFAAPENRPAAFSPGSTILAVCNWQTIELWDLHGDKLLRQFSGNSLAFSPDGKLLAVADRDRNTPRRWDGMIRVCEVATGQERFVLRGHRRPITSVQFSPDGKTLVSGGEDCTVRLWDAASGKELRRFEGHRDTVTCVAFAPDGRTVVSGSRDSTGLVWDVTRPRP